MSDSPLKQDSTFRISYRVTLKGTALASQYHVVKIEVDTNINKLPYATIQIVDGNMAEQRFENLDTLNISPGDDVKVEVGYEEKNKVIFEGIVSSVSTGGDSGAQELLTIEATDKCRALTMNRKSKYFISKTDSQIVSEIIGKYNGITSQQDSTSTTHKKMVQVAATDWDFILSRATVCSRVIVVENNKLKFVEPSGSDTASLEYGFDIIDFNMQVNGPSQMKSVSIKGWDPSNHSFASGSSKEPSFDKQGDGSVKGSKLADNFNYVEEKLYTSTPMESSELNDYASSRLLYSRLARMRGSFKVQGFADIKINSYVELKKLHKYYTGQAYVSGVKHTLSEGNYISDITIGLEENAVEQQESAPSMHDNFGTSPSARGLMIGTVTKMDSDPDGDYRVQVKIPMFDENDEGLWARLTNQYAGKEGGFIWYPEVGDQVIVGFLMNDARYPIIVGSLYSKKFSPYTDFRPASGNHKKAIVTRSHMEMSFDDQNKNIQIKTPGGHTFDIKDQDKSITLEDSHGNMIKMDQSGIEIKSIKDINMTANQGKIDIKSMSDCNLSSMKIKIAGKTSTNLEGSPMSTLKLDPSGATMAGTMLDLSGKGMAGLSAPLVKIN